MKTETYKILQTFFEEITEEVMNAVKENASRIVERNINVEADDAEAIGYEINNLSSKKVTDYPDWKIDDIIKKTETKLKGVLCP